MRGNELKKKPTIQDKIIASPLANELVATSSGRSSNVQHGSHLNDSSWPIYGSSNGYISWTWTSQTRVKNGSWSPSVEDDFTPGHFPWFGSNFEFNLLSQNFPSLLLLPHAKFHGSWLKLHANGTCQREQRRNRGDAVPTSPKQIKTICVVEG